jgi:cytochrome bd ubiquinol oxidase subunit I
VTFIIVYFFVYPAGVFYLFRLSRTPPDFVNPEMNDAPMKAAGIMPGPTLSMKNREGANVI